MKNIVMIGNALTGIKAFEMLKGSGVECSLTVVPGENTFPYLRDCLPELFVKKISQAKLLYHPQAEYDRDQVRFIFDTTVSRVNFKRGRVTLENKEQLDYDHLWITEMPPLAFDNIRGNNKERIYHCKRLVDLNAFVKTLPMIETIVLQSDELAGLIFALNLVAANRDIILITSLPRIGFGSFSADDAEFLTRAAAARGVRVITESGITEILGDHEAKAVRIKNGKVIGCQAVLTDQSVTDLRIFKDTDLVCAEKIAVNERHQTNYDNVFAFDAVCDRIRVTDWDLSLQYLESAQEQAQVVAAAIIGQEFFSGLKEYSWMIHGLADVPVQIQARLSDDQSVLQPHFQILRQESAV